MKIHPLILSLMLVAVAAPCQAGVFSDSLSKCIVASISDADRVLFVRWTFSTLAQHPDMAAIASVTDEQRKILNKSAVRLLERLLTVSCRQQTKDVVKNEGLSAIAQSARVLGQVSARSLMTHPAVDQGMEALDLAAEKAMIKIQAEVMNR